MKKKILEKIRSNNITLQSYELGVDEYLAKTPDEVSGSFKGWIDEALGLLSPNARIIEIGSGSGRDACYIESLGFAVERTDAAGAFVTLLQQSGYSARLFNILTDDFTSTYDLVFANAVFLHFTGKELRKVLDKIHDSLNEKGLVAFSVQKGEDEEWTTRRIGQPRYFCYWREDKIKSLLQSAGFDVISTSEDERFLQIIATKLNH